MDKEKKDGKNFWRRTAALYENEDADAGWASDATAEALASRRSAACSPNDDWAAELQVKGGQPRLQR